MNLALSMHTDFLASRASGRGKAAELTPQSGGMPPARRKLALELAFDDDVRLVLPTRQLLNLPDKEVMFVLEVGF